MSRIISDAEFIRGNSATHWDSEYCPLAFTGDWTSFGGHGRLKLDMIRKQMSDPNYRRPKPLWK